MVRGNDDLDSMVCRHRSGTLYAAVTCASACTDAGPFVGVRQLPPVPGDWRGVNDTARDAASKSAARENHGSSAPRPPSRLSRTSAPARRADDSPSMQPWP